MPDRDGWGGVAVDRRGGGGTAKEWNCKGEEEKGDGGVGAKKREEEEGHIVPRVRVAFRS
jgi:hypothetical protein